MPLTFHDDMAVLEGACGLEEAERLLEWFLLQPAGKVDISGCQHLHTAVMQVLLAARAPVVGAPRDPHVQAWWAACRREGAQ